MQYAENLCNMAQELLIMCNDKCSFDQKVFDVKMKNFYHVYKKSSLEVQSMYHEIWRARLMD